MSGAEGSGGIRVGNGYDIHRLVPGRPLVLAGVTLPWDLGLDGHSDGDVICHAVSDALLGAAALGDMGRHFPSSDPRWQDESSLGLLSMVVALVDQAGYAIENVDVTVILEVPRIEPYQRGMTDNLAGAIGVSIDKVSLKAKSHDRLGPVGAGEAIAAMAVALIQRRA